MSTDTIEAPVGRAWQPPKVTYTPDGLFRWDGAQWQTVVPPVGELPRPRESMPVPKQATPVPSRTITTLHLMLLLAALVIGATGVTVVGLTA